MTALSDHCHTIPTGVTLGGWSDLAWT